jgi:nitrogen regulatory protein PII
LNRQKEDFLKRITVVLKTSEVTDVRKAIFAAGGNRIVVAPVSHHLCAVELAGWYCGTPGAERDDYARLDVTVDDGQSREVVSAIIATAHTGMIEKIAFLHSKASRIASDHLAECAA